MRYELIGVILAATGCGHSAARRDPAPHAEEVAPADAQPAEQTLETNPGLTIESSFPCDTVMVNREAVSDPLPATIHVPPGHITGLCLNNTYELGMWESVEVPVARDATLSFSWAILVNRLENPPGRITIENPEDPTVMIDLGISSPEVGVPVPDDGHELKMILRDMGGNELATRSIRLEAGKRYDVTW